MHDDLCLIINTTLLHCIIDEYSKDGEYLWVYLFNSIVTATYILEAIFKAFTISCLHLSGWAHTVLDQYGEYNNIVCVCFNLPVLCMHVYFIVQDPMHCSFCGAQVMCLQ